MEKSLKGAAIRDEVKDRLKKSALGLSGGQQQRLCIARVLAVEPEILNMRSKFDEAKKDIIKLILEKPAEGEETTDLLMVAKYFERIGDHATNIAEWVIYSLRTSEE